MHRDTYHADLGIGRYLLGLTWYKALTGKRAEKEFCDFDVKVTEGTAEIIKNIM